MNALGLSLDSGTRLEVRGGAVTVHERMNRGVLSDVYRASYDVTGRELVLKVARASAGPDSLEVHARERDALDRLTQRDAVGVPRLVAAGTFSDEPYLALPFIPGITLRQLLKLRKTLPVGASCLLGCQILRTLADVHKNGLVHCDVKPSNILLERKPTGHDLWLIDFGIAQTDEAPPRVSTTICGTPQYMAPEQLLCERVDPRTDIFALGVILYECLTGHRPFTCSDMQSAVHSQLRDDVLPVDVIEPGCPRDLADFVEALLARNPARRPACASAARLALADIAYRLRAEHVRLSSSPPPAPSVTESSTVTMLGRI